MARGFRLQLAGATLWGFEVTAVCYVIALGLRRQIAGPALGRLEVTAVGQLEAWLLGGVLLGVVDGG